MKAVSVYLQYTLKVADKLVCTLYMYLKEKKKKDGEKNHDDNQSFVR